MKIIEQLFSSRAWCVHRTGRIIPVRVHPFGAYDDDAIEDAAWLYIYDNDYDPTELIRYLANQFYYDYRIDTQWTYDDIYDLIHESIFDIECLKGVAGVGELVDDIVNHLVNNSYSVRLTPAQTEDLGGQIKRYLNTSYMRVRYASEYQNYSERHGAIYFRISSTDGFNWYNTILKFIENISTSLDINEVTVEKDKSSTGVYKLYIDHIPIEEFLLQRPIVIESVKACGN